VFGEPDAPDGRICITLSGSHGTCDWPRGDGPRAHSGLYRQEAETMRKHPYHQRAPGRAGRKAGGPMRGVRDLTSPTFRRLPSPASGAMRRVGRPPLGAEARRLIAIRIDPQVSTRAAEAKGEVWVTSPHHDLLAKHIGTSTERLGHADRIDSDCCAGSSLTQRASAAPILLPQHPETGRNGVRTTHQQKT